MPRAADIDDQLCPPSHCPDPEGCDVAGQTAQLLRRRLTAAAMQEPDGKLGPEALARLINGFSRGLDERLAPHCLSTLACSGALGGRRQLLFERILTGRFAAFLDDDPPHLANPDHLRISRRVLPGFFRALEDLAGVAVMEQCRERAREIAEAVAAEQGAAGMWQMLPGDPRAQALVNEFAAHLAPAFLDPEANYPLVARRVINALPLGQADEDPGLVFDWSHFLVMVRSLFNDFRPHNRSAALGERLAMAFDAETRANVAQALLALDQSSREEARSQP